MESIKVFSVIGVIIATLSALGYNWVTTGNPLKIERGDRKGYWKFFVGIGLLIGLMPVWLSLFAAIILGPLAYFGG